MRLRSALHERHAEDRIIGQSPAILRARELALNVADTQTSVLIQGESGTGKELLANLIHYNSRRKEGPYVKLNCGAIPESLLESELFGHERGAFTDARQRRRGRFEEADGGTLFLDEIGEMSLSAQVRLLRVLQDGEFARVGANEVLRADVRVIAATNVDLERADRSRARSAATSTTASRSSPSSSRPCASGPRTCTRSSYTSSNTTSRRPVASSRASRPRRCARSSRTTGRGTSASWRTPSSAPSSSPRVGR